MSLDYEVSQKGSNDTCAKYWSKCRNLPVVGNGAGPRNISTFYVTDTQDAHGGGHEDEAILIEWIQIVEDLLFYGNYLNFCS